MKKYVYLFDDPKTGAKSTFVLGNKGAQLAEMTKIGLPVPYGFTISTEACNGFYDLGKKWPEGLENEIKQNIKSVEKKTGKSFGGTKKPLLVSVRSGSYVSMPGMMDTVLNIGLNDETVLGLAKFINSERGAWDSYRRLLQMFGDVVLGVAHHDFETILTAKKKKTNTEKDTDLSIDDLNDLVVKYKELIKSETGKPFPDEPWEQLRLAIDAVFNSWNIPRAVTYRKINHLKMDAGTGVNVQAMVFGNAGDDSATGVSFTRNPATGENEHYGEFLVNAQGEDVVAGIRTPLPVDELKNTMPKQYEELLKVYDTLEKHYKDVQDFEFTIEQGKLYVLQTRNGKRTAHAAVKIAVDMHKEGLISKEDAILQVKAGQLDQLLHKQLDQEAKKTAEVIAKGLPASPGAAVGKVVFTAEKAIELHEKNHDEKLILVRTETSPEDIGGMNVAQGILTARGGMTSHAAVVARAMGKCCVAGCNDIAVHNDKEFKTKEATIKEGEWITLDGSTGEVMKGQLPVTEPKLDKDFEELMSWADEFRTMKILANADTPKDAAKALEFGAEGIGLCRTEHMFFEGERITAVREMIIAENLEDRKKALAKILPMQKEDFKAIYKVMNDLPVVIRLLDPPLHEFLPKENDEIEVVAKDLGVDAEKIKAKVNSLMELNPMLGFRGCRLGLSFPEITEMQVQAIIEAALEVQKEGITALPYIEVPLVGESNELKKSREIIEATVKKFNKDNKVKYQIGTMIELPRACITADEIVKHADFLSFGTNDLTQTTYGYSRDDVGKFVPNYVEKGILKQDPFQKLDQEGVGELMKICVEKAKSVKPNVGIGICGEHGGEPSSVEFCHKIGLNDVSCSPYRVPIARLAAAQAALKEKQKK
ncbi:MAG: pyruvate, phosphate dikinase [Candidatus Diapherotrites archaeon]